MSQRAVIQAYSVAYPHPIRIKKGEIVAIEKWEQPGSEWAGWAFCIDPRGVKGWVSQNYLEVNGSSGQVVKDYEATELDVTSGELVKVHSEELGWAWVENASGRQGWIPVKNLASPEHKNAVKLIEEFERTWEYIRGMRDAFIRAVPDSRWNFSHHPKFAPLVKQFKHVIKVYGCYIDALETRRLDMNKKKEMFSGLETRENILGHLSNLDARLTSVLGDLKTKGLERFQVELFGMKMGFSEYTHVMIHHDVSHFGIWANYAAFGEFETPETWRQDWKL